MKFTVFRSVTHSQGRGFDLSVSNLWTNYFSKIHCRREKDGPLISLCTFRGHHRSIIDCGEYCGAVLDFDNQREVVGEDGKKKKIPVDNPDTPDLALTELAGTLFFFHSTFSTTSDCVKWRLIVPFAEPIPPSEYLAVYDEIVERLGNPAGLCPTGRELARCFYLPSCNRENQRIAFVRHSPGEIFKPQRLLIVEKGIEEAANGRFAPDPREGKDHSWLEQSAEEAPAPVKGAGGRNNSLKAQISAGLGKGKPIDVIVQEVLEYDREHHSPPLFEDKSEGYVPGQPEIGAWRLVSNIAFSHARNSGEQIRVTEQATAVEVPELLVDQIEEAHAKRKKRETSVETLCKSAPGIVGEIAEWITATAPKPQPVLSLGAALALVGVVKGHRFQTGTGLRTNLYLLGLGPSGCGKEHPSRAVGQLVKEAGLESIISGVPASDAGLLKAIEVNRGRALILWDEFGHALSSFTGFRSAPHEKKIVDTLLKLFSKANAVYNGKEYGNHHGKMARTDLVQPCLGIWGTTVPERLYEALTSSMVLDGFTPRFLVLEVTNPDVPLRPIAGGAPPAPLVARLVELNNQPTNITPRGGFDFDPHPAVLELSTGAREVLADCEADFDRRKVAARGDRGVDSIWSRGAEHVAKVALTVAAGAVIEQREMEWSAKLVTACLNLAVSMTEERITDNEAERRLNRLHRIIILAGKHGMTTTELARQTAWAIHDRKRLLDELEQSEKIVRMVFKGTTRPTVRYFDNFLQRAGELGISQGDLIA